MVDENERENKTGAVKARRTARGAAKPAAAAPEVTNPSPAPAPTAQPAAAAPVTPPPPSQPAPPPQLDVLAGVMSAAGSTVRIVQKAVSVLEEELAAGITTTQKLEQKVVDVEKLRAADPQEVVQRFRRDAHDVVDILIDLVNVATNSLDQLTQRVIRVGVREMRPGSPASRENTPAGGGIPSLAVATPVKPGGSVEIPMTLENESSKPTEVFYLLSSDLVNPNGDRIAAGQVSFTPAQMAIEPQKSAVITVTVQVPGGTPPGTYSGLLQATKLEQLRAVLSIQIE